MTHNEEIVVFHYRLGVAITQWAAIEQWLRIILIIMFKDEELNHESLTVGIFSLEGFRVKLQLADGVISRKLAGTKHAAEWASLVKRAGSASTQRNKLAHWPLIPYPLNRSGRRIALVPWITPKSNLKSKIRKPPPGALCVNDIIRSAKDFISLAAAFEKFWHHLEGAEEPPLTDLERSYDQLTAEKTARQIREVFSPRRRSSEKKS